MLQTGIEAYDTKTGFCFRVNAMIRRRRGKKYSGKQQIRSQLNKPAQGRKADSGKNITVKIV